MTALEELYAKRFAELYGYDFENRDGTIILKRCSVEYERFNDIDEYFNFITMLTNE